MEQLGNNKRVRDDSAESEFDSLEVQRLRDDLLGRDIDNSDLCATGPNLDSFMKSFYSVITPPTVNLTSHPSESLAGFGFLLEISNDELGLPPSRNLEISNDESHRTRRVNSVSCGGKGEAYEEGDGEEGVHVYYAIEGGDVDAGGGG
ncbi:hypothetical protein Vadar_017819 [Vaccinium darrowii]|uniref:Uncharacterized protein n=1 Tax=Vaccinium darrowii TaxID=229202 RepID=A0ACB7YE33_9ERIC|nr:hypothetical protein Vadar_017819 [Vaccinium darrowii]